MKTFREQVYQFAKANNQLAKDNAKNPLKALFLGGLTKEESINILKQYGL